MKNVNLCPTIYQFHPSLTKPDYLGKKPTRWCTPQSLSHTNSSPGIKNELYEINQLFSQQSQKQNLTPIPRHSQCLKSKISPSSSGNNVHMFDFFSQFNNIADFYGFSRGPRFEFFFAIT